MPGKLIFRTPLFAALEDQFIEFDKAQYPRIPFRRLVRLLEPFPGPKKMRKRILIRGGGALDLIGPAVAFRHTHQRWPKNYTELSPLVEQTDGKAQARQYDRVDLTELPDGSLEIYSVAHGQTNRITLPFKETNAK